MEEAVVAAKSRRQSAEVLLELDLETLLRGSGDELKKGDGQQPPWVHMHACETSLKQGDCIFSLSFLLVSFNQLSFLIRRIINFFLPFFGLDKSICATLS